MLKVRKILAVALSMVMCTNLGVTAFAANETVDLEEKIRITNQSETISEEEIQELINDVNASLVYEDGTVVPVETVITIKDIGTSNTKTRSSNSVNTYAVTVDSKIESDADSKNNEGVSASIYLKMVWQDVVGPNNILESVCGNIDISEGTITKSIVKYGDAGRAGSRRTLNLGTQTSFQKVVNMEAYIPQASYTVNFEGAIFELNVSVTPSVFD